MMLRLLLVAGLFVVFAPAQPLLAGDTLTVQAGPLTALGPPETPPGFKKVILFKETFDTDTVDTADTLATYPAFTANDNGPYRVTNGVLLTNDGDFTIDGSAFTGPFMISADITRTSGGTGSAPVGVQLGPNQIVFHPGYSGGAFRFEPFVGNTNMGFTVNHNATDELHNFLIEADGTGNFNVTITDAGNPANVFNFGPINSPGAVGGVIGLDFHVGGGTAYFDNFEIFRYEAVPPLTPEPSSMLLLGSALTAVAGWNWRRRKRAS